MRLYSCSIPTWQGKLRHATIRRSLEAHKQWYVGSNCPHIDIMYRVTSAEFLPHSIAHKLAGNVPCLGHVFKNMLFIYAKTFCLDCIACNKKNLQILRKLLLVEKSGRAGRKFYPPLDSGCQTPEQKEATVRFSVLSSDKMISGLDQCLVNGSK